jgi:hypothetical protein
VALQASLLPPPSAPLPPFSVEPAAPPLLLAPPGEILLAQPSEPLPSEACTSPSPWVLPPLVMFLLLELLLEQRPLHPKQPAPAPRQFALALAKEKILLPPLWQKRRKQPKSGRSTLPERTAPP